MQYAHHNHEIARPVMQIADQIPKVDLGLQSNHTLVGRIRGRGVHKNQENAGYCQDGAQQHEQPAQAKGV